MYNIRLKWLTVCCFEMCFGDTAIVTDPYITAHENNDLTYENIENCDIITLSHIHWDHITDLPALLEKFPAVLLTGPLSAEPVLRWIDCNPSRVYPMDSNLELDFGGIKVKALFGKHITPFAESVSALEQHFSKNSLIKEDPSMFPMQITGSLEYRNYLFTGPNGAKILIWGGEPSTVQKNICKDLKPDIAIMQISSKDIERTAGFAAEMGCKIVIPQHHDHRKTPEEYMPKLESFRKALFKLSPDCKLIIPRNNEWIDL